MKLDPMTTAVLTLDIQQGILGFAPGAAAAAIPNAGRAADAARKGGYLLLHVGIGFEPGYPELGVDNPRLARMKQMGGFIKGSESAKTHKDVYKPGDIVLYKHRTSAFSGSPLETVFRAQGIKTLVLMGIATSGIVLSTLRQASDLDYQCVVVKDACFDADGEVHRVLTEKVFARQATVVTTQELLRKVCVRSRFMTRKENAVNLYKQSFNCSQAVFTAYRQDELSETAALKLATVFGAGVASTGSGLCGAVAGALMAISMKYGKGDAAGNDAKMKTYALGREFMEKFAEKNGSCVCEQILGINIGTPENMEKARAMKLFETKCLDAVKTACDILEKMI